MRNQLVQKFEPLRCQCEGQYSYPGGISARSVETRDETEPNGIITAHEGNRNRTGCRLGRSNRRAIRENHGYPTAYQVGRECRQAIVLILRPAVFNLHILPFHIAGLLQALPERGRHRRVAISRCAVEKSDHSQSRLLCMTGQRPGDRRAAGKGDEFPPSQMTEPHLPPSVRGPHCILLEMASRGQWVCDLGSQRAWRPRESAIGTKLLFAAVQNYVRFLGYSGREMLAVRLSDFDPEPTSIMAPFQCCPL